MNAGATRETAYIFALSSASVSRVIARACSEGALTSCSCGAQPRRIPKHFIWSGCSHNIRYANKFGRKFFDEVELIAANDAR